MLAIDGKTLRRSFDRLTLDPPRTARPKIPVDRKRKRSGWSDDFAGSVLGQMR